jgi:hypothetical protein
MSISGEWLLNYDFGFTGQYSQAILRFNADGTFVSPDVTGDAGGDSHGKWVSHDGQLLLQFQPDQLGATETARATYSGVVQENVMVGIMAFCGQQESGCWFAVQSGSNVAVQRGAAVAARRPELNLFGRPKKQ